MNVATSAKVAAKVTQEKVNVGVAAVKRVHNIAKECQKGNNMVKNWTLLRLVYNLMYGIRSLPKKIFIYF